MSKREKKTTLEWIRGCGEKWSEDAVSEMAIDASRWGIQVDRLSEALIEGFYWSNSSRGHDYWNSIFKKLVAAGK